MAEHEGVPFCILSGKFGLVDWNHPLPLYDHLLMAEEVPQLVEVVKKQIGNKGITQVDYYSRSPEVDARIIPYINTIENACASIGVDLQTYILEEPKINSAMRNWKQITEMSADTRQTLISDRVQGEQAFAQLLTLFPDDGMVFLQRGNAYATIGEFKLAKMDFEAAERLFPMERWRLVAREAAARIDQEFAAGGTIAEARRRINGLTNIDAILKRNALIAIEKAIIDPVTTATEIRRCEEALVNQIMSNCRLATKGNLDVNIKTLKDQAVVPEIVANHMNTVRLIGNRAVHSNPGETELQSGDVYPSITALVAIIEWMDKSDI
jgi:tetratricopeptide (TPR) repeat protein